MNKKKKAVVVICSIALLLPVALLFFFGINTGPTIQESVDKRVEAYETDLRDSIDSFKDKASVTKYLVNWGENKGIDVKTDYSGNVIYSIPANKKTSDSKSMVLICAYDYKCMDSYINSIVSALSVAKTTTEHEDLKIIFICENEDDKKSIENLSSEYFIDNTEIFYLKDTKKSQLSLLTGGCQQYTISKYYQQTLPENTKAYTIKLKGLPTFAVNRSNVENPNPILQLGKLLAKFKSNYINFELANFTGGTGAKLTPSSATMTIIVNDDNTEKVEKLLNKDIEKFIEKYSERYSDVHYSFKVIKTPQQVVNKEVSEHLVSLMYTLLNGVYSNSGEEITSIINVGRISIENGYISLNAFASGSSKSTLSEIKSSYQTISALAEMDFTVTYESPVFKASKASSEICTKFQASYKKFKGNEIKVSNMPECTLCSKLSEKNKNMNIVVLGISKNSKDDFTGALITYMQSQW